MRASSWLPSWELPWPDLHKLPGRSTEYGSQPLMSCSHFHSVDGKGFCGVATWWAGSSEVPVTPEACKVCLSSSVPRGLNQVTVSIGLTHLSQTDPAMYHKKLPEAIKHVAAPGASEKLVRYAKATAEWVKQGRPTRSDGEVLQILEICNGCDNWLPEEGACRLCGCHINSGNAWVNKARRLNEHCPLEKW